MGIERVISLTHTKRLNIERQHLSGGNSAGMLEVARSLGCLQLDPTSVVAKSHLLVLWSRLGAFDMAELDALLWDERHLFEYWAHAASIVLTEDYPLHYGMMRNHVTDDSAWALKVREWLQSNQALHDHILQELEQRGPLLSREFSVDNRVSNAWVSTGWTSGQNVSRMLDFLWTRGTIMVAGRKGGQKVWDLTERCLPHWISKDELSPREITYRAAQKAIRALGVAQAKDIKYHYIRGRYAELESVLKQLEAEGKIVRARIEDNGQTLAGVWYIHADDLAQLERIEHGEWQPKTTLLSPFDNLICDRNRLQLLFNFDYKLEIYTPKDKRKYGFFVLPILHGDQLIGRIDPVLNRKTKQFTINAVYAEPNAPADAAPAIAKAVQDLAAFLDANEVTYTERVPDMWKLDLR